MFSNRFQVFALNFFQAFQSRLVTRILYAFLGIIALVSVAIVGLWMIRDHYRIGWNLTESLPQKVFIVKVGEMPAKGDYVAFSWHPKFDSLVAPYPNEAMFIKIVAGIPGDVVQVTNREVSVNGESVGYAKPTSRTGLPLQETKPGSISNGQLYVRGTHRDSFDSRYALVGNVLVEHVIGKAYPIF